MTTIRKPRCTCPRNHFVPNVNCPRHGKAAKLMVAEVAAKATPRDDQIATYGEALRLLTENSELEPTSAFKEAAHRAGIPWGEEMGRFVTWARARYVRQVMKTPKQKAKTIHQRLAEQEQWIADHGGSEAGYVERYGAASDPNHFGSGGEAIYAADYAELQKLQILARNFEAKARSAQAKAWMHADRLAEHMRRQRGDK